MYCNWPYEERSRRVEESRGTACVYRPVPRHLQLLEIALEQRPVIPRKLENEGRGSVSNQRISFYGFGGVQLATRVLDSLVLVAVDWTYLRRQGA